MNVKPREAIQRSCPDLAAVTLYSHKAAFDSCIHQAPLHARYLHLPFGNSVKLHLCTASVIFLYIYIFLMYILGGGPGFYYPTASIINHNGHHVCFFCRGALHLWGVRFHSCAAVATNVSVTRWLDVTDQLCFASLHLHCWSSMSHRRQTPLLFFGCSFHTD